MESFVPPFSFSYFHSQIRNKEDVFIGCSVIIRGGVRIGKHSVIGAGTVVTKDVPENSVMVGCPGKVIGST